MLCARDLLSDQTHSEDDCCTFCLQTCLNAASLSVEASNGCGFAAVWANSGSASRWRPGWLQLPAPHRAVHNLPPATPLRNTGIDGHMTTRNIYRFISVSDAIHLTSTSPPRHDETLARSQSSCAAIRTWKAPPLVHRSTLA